MSVSPIFANGAITAAYANLYNAQQGAQKGHKLHLIASKNAPVGHVAIAGEAPDGTVVARGFYPKDKSVDIALGSVPGVVKDDIRLFRDAQAGEDGVLMQTLSVTQTEHDAALRFMNGFAKSNQYNLYKCSCVTAALESLNAAGVAGFNSNVTGALPHSIYKAIDLGLEIPAP